MEFIVALSIAVSCFSYSEAQFPVPGNFISTSGPTQQPFSPSSIPSSLRETFTTAYSNDLKSWADFNTVFNVTYIPAFAAVYALNLTYARAVKSGMNSNIALSDARNVSRAVYETAASLTPESLIKAVGYVYFDVLVYGNVVNSKNVLQLAHTLSNVYKDTFSKHVSNNLQGIVDASEAFLTPFNLYDAAALYVNDRQFAKYLYVVTGVPSPIK